MYSYVLIASHHRQPPGPRSEEAYFEEFAIVPFARARSTLRAVGAMFQRISTRRAGPSRHRRTADVL